MTDSSFSYYKTVAGTELLHDIIFKSEDKIQISGTRNDPFWKYFNIQTYLGTISSHFNITGTSFTFSQKSGSDYPISFSGTLSNYSLVNYSMSEFTLNSIPATHTYYSIWQSDVSYWFGNTSDTRELQSSTYYEIDIYLTCSVAGNTTITYDLTSDDNGTVPSWITLDTSDRKLKFTTPELDADSNFTFSVEATVSGDTNTYVNKYYLEVLRVNTTNNT